MDKSAFQQEVLALAPFLHRVSFSILHNEADCKDAVQTALELAWKHRFSLRDREKFRPWITRILVHECYEMIKKRKKERNYPLEMVNQSVEQPTLSLPIGEALSMLKPEWRVLVVLHYMEGYSMQELSDLLKIPLGTVKTRLKFARKRLRILLKDEWEESPCMI